MVGIGQKFFAACLLVLLLLPPLSVGAQDEFAPRDRHPWGRFEPGAWKRVQVRSETLAENLAVNGVTTKETTTTLHAVDDRSYVLNVEVSIDVAGRNLASQPRLVRHGFNGDAAGQSVTVKQLGEGELVIGGTRATTEIRQITMTNADSRIVSTVHYNEKFEPPVLKRETTASDLEGKKVLYQTTVEVMAVEMPFRVLDAQRKTAHVRTVQKQADGTTTVTLEVLCAEIPGSVVAHWSAAWNPEGRVIERSTLDLVAFGTVSSQTNVVPLRPRTYPTHRRRSRTP